MCPIFRAAYQPDGPMTETEQNIRAAIEFHLDGMREDGDPIPDPTTVTVSVEIPTA